MAGYTNAAKDIGLDAIGAAGTWISAHTADPGQTGANEVNGGTYARVQTTWSAAAGSSKAGTQVTLNIPAGVTITHWGVWSANSAGTFYESEPLAAQESYGSAGTYLLTPTLTASG